MVSLLHNKLKADYLTIFNCNLLGTLLYIYNQKQYFLLHADTFHPNVYKLQDWLRSQSYVEWWIAIWCILP